MEALTFSEIGTAFFYPAPVARRPLGLPQPHVLAVGVSSIMIIPNPDSVTPGESGPNTFHSIQSR